MTATTNSFAREQILNHRIEQVNDHRYVDRCTSRMLGAYYTNSATTLMMADWAIRTPTDRILEPCFGDGSFLRAVHSIAQQKGFSSIQQFGAELVSETYARAIQEGLLPLSRAHHGDFLSLQPFETNVVIGNPPYVRMRHLPTRQQQLAIAVASQVLGHPMDPNGSLWMPFVLHATQFLPLGGRLALVLPFELTHVRYARPLWNHLGRSFGSLRVIRAHERIFPDILQDVVLLFADEFGGSTTEVQFQAFEKAADIGNFLEQPSTNVSLNEVVSGKKAFLQALLPGDAVSLFQELFSKHTMPVRKLCTFNIGYVTGDKKFFHPDSEIVRSYQLPLQSLKKALTSSRQLSGHGLWTATGPPNVDSLFFPPLKKTSLSKGELRYIKHGMQNKIHERYKCKVREPWYRVPGVKTPDLVLSVFTERPMVVINDRKLLASNSLLCGYLRKGSAEPFAAAWYTSLTLLGCELEIHALGGGVFVMMPGEVGNIQLPRIKKTGLKRHLAAIDQLLKKGDVLGAYASGDEAILQGQLGLTRDDVNTIKRAVSVLHYWRTSSRGGMNSIKLSED
jgi:adenine-specific DNA-methyltransferase